MAKANMERPRGRKTILHGETWGQHDPIRGEWTLKPSSSAFKACIQPGLSRSDTVTDLVLDFT